MDYVLRQATPDDAEAIVRMHTLAHEECYPHLLSPAFFAARREAIPERVARRRNHPDVEDPRVIAVDANNEVVGFADAGPGRDEDGPVPLELYSIYILARAQGLGLGSALVGAAIGESPAYLWVLEDNLRAQAFPPARLPAGRQARPAPARVGSPAGNADGPGWAAGGPRAQ